MSLGPVTTSTDYRYSSPSPTDYDVVEILQALVHVVEAFVQVIKARIQSLLNLIKPLIDRREARIELPPQCLGLIVDCRHEDNCHGSGEDDELPNRLPRTIGGDPVDLLDASFHPGHSITHIGHLGLQITHLGVDCAHAQALLSQHGS